MKRYFQTFVGIIILFLSFFLPLSLIKLIDKDNQSDFKQKFIAINAGKLKVPYLSSNVYLSKSKSIKKLTSNSIGIKNIKYSNIPTNEKITINQSQSRIINKSKQNANQKGIKIQPVLIHSMLAKNNGINESRLQEESEQINKTQQQKIDSLPDEPYAAPISNSGWILLYFIFIYACVKFLRSLVSH